MTVYPVSKVAVSQCSRQLLHLGLHSPPPRMAGQPPKQPGKNAYGSPASTSCVGAGQGAPAATSSVPLPTSVDLLLARGAEAGSRRRSSAVSGASRASGRSRRSPRDRSAPTTSPVTAVDAAHGEDPARQDSGLGSSQGGQDGGRPVGQDEHAVGGGREPQPSKARGLFGEETSLACTYRATVRRASASSRARSRSGTAGKSAAAAGRGEGARDTRRDSPGLGEGGSGPRSSPGAVAPSQVPPGSPSAAARAGGVSASLDDDDELAARRPKGLHGEDASMSCSARPSAPAGGRAAGTGDSPMAPADDAAPEQVGDDLPTAAAGAASAPTSKLEADGTADGYSGSPTLVQKMSKGLLAAERSTPSCSSGQSSPGGGLAAQVTAAKIRGIFGDDTSASCHQPAGPADAARSGAPGTPSTADRDRAQTFLNTPPSAQARTDMHADASFPSGEVMASKHTIGDTPAVSPRPLPQDAVSLGASRGRGDSGQQLDEAKTLDLSDVRRSVCLDQDIVDDADADDDAVAVFTSVDQEPSEVNLLLADELGVEERIEVAEDSDFQTGDEGGTTEEEEDDVGELAAVGGGEAHKERALESDYATADEDEEGEADTANPVKAEGPPLPYKSECVKEALTNRGVPEEEQGRAAHKVSDETRRTDDLAAKDEERVDGPHGVVEDTTVQQGPEGDAAFGVDAADVPAKPSECFAQEGGEAAPSARHDEERLRDDAHTVLDLPALDAQTEIPEQVLVEDTDSGRGDSITDMDYTEGLPAEEAPTQLDDALAAEDVQPALLDAPKAEAEAQSCIGSGEHTGTAEAVEQSSAPLLAYTSECLRPVRSEPRDNALASANEGGKDEGIQDLAEEHPGKDDGLQDLAEGQQAERIGEPLASLAEAKTMAEEGVSAMKSSGSLQEGRSICVPSVTALPEQLVGAASEAPAQRIPDIRASLSDIGPRCLPEICEVAPIADEVTPTASIRVSPPAELTTASLAVGQTSTADLDIGSAVSSRSLLAPPSGQEIPSPPPEPAGRDFEVQQDAEEVEEAVDITGSQSAAFKSECLGSHPPTGQDDMQLGAPSKSQEKPPDVDKVDAEIVSEIGGEEQQSPGLPTEEERRGGQVGTASAETPLKTGSGSPDLPAVAVQLQPHRALKNECIRDPGGSVPAVVPQDTHAQHLLNEDDLGVEHPVVRRDTPFPPLGVVGGPLDERIRSLTIDEPLLEEPEEEASLPAGATSFRTANAVPDATAAPAAEDPTPTTPSAADPTTADAAGATSESAEMVSPSPGVAADPAPPLSGPTFCTCEDDRVPRRPQAGRASLPGRETSAGPRPGDRMRRCSNCGEEWMSVLSGLEAASRRRAMVARTMAACERELGPLNEALRRLHEKVRALDLPGLSPQGAQRSASQAFYPEVLRIVQSRSATAQPGVHPSGPAPAAPAASAAPAAATPCPYCGLQLVPEAALSPLARMYILLSQRKGPPLPPEPPEPPDDQPEQF